MKIEATLKPRFFGKCFTLFALAIICSAAFSQAPQKFNYQGIARGQAGNILTNKNLSFKISILQGSPTGTAVYSESHNVVSDNSGAFSLEIGAGTILSGTFSGIGWGGNSHYLKTEMDTSGGANYQFMGTTQLLSVPYALNAGNSSGGMGAGTITSYIGGTGGSSSASFNITGGEGGFGSGPGNNYGRGGNAGNGGIGGEVGYQYVNGHNGTAPGGGGGAAGSGGSGTIGGNGATGRVIVWW